MIHRYFWTPDIRAKLNSNRPLCGQMNMGKTGWAESGYTDDPARITCKKCRARHERENSPQALASLNRQTGPAVADALADALRNAGVLR